MNGAMGKPCKPTFVPLSVSGHNAWLLSIYDRNEVRQFHLEQKKEGFVRSPDWSLGKHTRMVTIREKHAEDNLAEAKERPVTKVRHSTICSRRTCVELN
jgi:hypothetical protein